MSETNNHGPGAVLPWSPVSTLDPLDRAGFGATRRQLRDRQNRERCCWLSGCLPGRVTATQRLGGASQIRVWQCGVVWCAGCWVVCRRVTTDADGCRRRGWRMQRGRWAAFSRFLNPSRFETRPAGSSVRLSSLLFFLPWRSLSVRGAETNETNETNRS